MAVTNFNALTTEQKTVWSRDVWKVARNASFINRFAGKSHNSMVQRITELTKSERGARAVITLVPDLEGDGVAGDNTLEGNEEEIKAYDQVIQIDQLRNANRHKGKMAEQKSVVKFRETSKDVLGYWLADRLDQMAFLTLSGVAYTYKTDGTTRTGSQLPDLAFAADVTAPTAQGTRYFVWDGGNDDLTTNDGNDDLVAADTPSYKMLVKLKAKAKEQYVRGVKDANGEEVFHVFMTPSGMAALKLDADYLANIRGAGVRGSKNELFAGTTSVLVDGMWIHEYRHVYHASTWGSGAVAGQRVLFCGAQALGLADIGAPEWNEKGFDYDNQQGVEVGKIFGLLKPQFISQYSGLTTAVDFGVITCDTAV
jgi:N4-gp56 family major capsid protein